MSYHEKTTDAAHGRWKGILQELGVSEKHLTGRHGPCPMCGGSDRFRFDNKQGSGSWFCNNCGAGNGMDLAMAITGNDFKTCAGEVDEILGNKKVDHDEIRPEIDEAQRRTILRKVYSESGPVEKGDIVDRYLTNRGLGRDKYPDCIRTIERTADGEGGLKPAMLGVVHAGGKPVTMHRTFLDPETAGKAIMQSPRKLMPGAVPDGAAIPLFPWRSGVLGVAEGIETAYAAARIFRKPVHSCLNARMLEKWIPPEGCSEIWIFADNDPKYGGHAAAYRLAHMLACKGYSVTVLVPPRVGWDWNDVLLRWSELASDILERTTLEIDGDGADHFFALVRENPLALNQIAC